MKKAAKWIFIVSALLANSPAQSAVERPKRDFSVGVAYEIPSFQFKLTPTNKDIDEEVNYVPNVVGVSGFTVSAYGIGVRYLTQEEFSEQDLRINGRTSYDDIRLGTFLGDDLQFRVEGYYTRFKGLYIENTTEIDNTRSGSDPKIQRGDLEIVAYGAELLYIFSPKEFSKAASFSHSAIQSESGGSWMARLDWDRTSFKADSAIVPTQVATEFGEDAGLTDGNFSTLSLVGGYGYSFIRENWFFTPVLMFGYGLQARRFNLGGEEKDGVATVQKNSASLALGYNGEKFFGSIKGDLNDLIYKTGSIRIAQSMTAFTISLGIRF